MPPLVRTAALYPSRTLSRASRLLYQSSLASCSNQATISPAAKSVESTWSAARYSVRHSSSSQTQSSSYTRPLSLPSWAHTLLRRLVSTAVCESAGRSCSEARIGMPSGPFRMLSAAAASATRGTWLGHFRTEAIQRVLVRKLLVGPMVVLQLGGVKSNASLVS